MKIRVVLVSGFGCLLRVSVTRLNEMRPKSLCMHYFFVDALAHCIKN